MIGKLTGRVDYVAEDHALIEAAGVGYVVHCAASTLARLTPGAPAALYTELVVREDLMQLFGFPSLEEREWHRLLTSVQGVGARVSLAMLGALGPDGVARALALGDATALRRAPGVGPKLAARISNELKGRAPEPILRRAGAAAVPPPEPAGMPPEAPLEAPVGTAPPPSAPPSGQAEVDALSALLNLGFDRAEAGQAVLEAAAAAPAAEAPALIRTALRALAPKD
ncbi:MAG: Holliday junction branch migration protein RuvA [Pseudomonadota bacterium]